MIEVTYTTEHAGVLSLESRNGQRVRFATAEDLAAAGFFPKHSPGSAPVPAPQGTTIAPEVTHENSSLGSPLDARSVEPGEVLSDDGDSKRQLDRKREECATAWAMYRAERDERIRLGGEIGRMKSALAQILDSAPRRTRKADVAHPKSYFLIDREDHGERRWLTPGQLHSTELAWTKDKSVATRFDSLEEAELSLNLLKQQTTVALRVTEHGGTSLNAEFDVLRSAVGNLAPRGDGAL